MAITLKQKKIFYLLFFAQEIFLPDFFLELFSKAGKTSKESHIIVKESMEECGIKEKKHFREKLKHTLNRCFYYRLKPQLKIKLKANRQICL